MTFKPEEYDIASDPNGTVYLICSRPGCRSTVIEISEEDDEMPTLADLDAAARLHHAGTFNHIQPTKETI